MYLNGLFRSFSRFMHISMQLDVHCLTLVCEYIALVSTLSTDSLITARTSSCTNVSVSSVAS